MNKPSILNHVPHTVVDQSNIWKTDDVTDVPVYTPNSISLPGGIKVYDGLDPFEFAFQVGDEVLLLYGLDPRGRYTLLELGENKTYLRYKFGGRSFPQKRSWSCPRFEDGELYLSGGVLNGDPMADMWSYNLDSKTWSIIGSLPSPRWKHSILFTEDKIFLYGGQTRSAIDNRYLYLNDLFWAYRTTPDDWNLLDREALLPHEEGCILGEDSGVVYLLINRQIWTVEGDVTNQVPGTLDMLPIVTDTRMIDGTVYLLSKSDHSSPVGNLYSWTISGGMVLVAEDVISIPESPSQTVRIDGGRVYLGDDRLGATSPPIDPDIPHCQLNEGRAYYTDRTFHITRFDTMHTEEVIVSDPDLPLSAQIANIGDYIYTVGWIDGIIKVGRLDLTDHSFEHLADGSNVTARDNASLCAVQNTLWLMGGETAVDGYIADQWKLNLNEGFDWVQEITLEPLPAQPFAIFEWRNRLWLIPNTIRSLYRYYPSMKQWTTVYISHEDTEHQELGLYRRDNRWSVVDNRLMLEPRGYERISIHLESRSARSVIYSGDLWFGIDRAHVVNTDGRLFLSDGTEMTTAIVDQPPHFENSSYEGETGLALVEKHPYMTWGFDDLGRYLPSYSDKAGFFWIDNVNARVREPEEAIGFYVPETDYNGKLGDHYRRLPSFTYRPRDKRPLFTGVEEVEFSGSRFVTTEGKITRFRTQDGTFFDYNAPVSNGSAVACSGNGEVYVFGGITFNNVIAQDQQGIEESGPAGDSGGAILSQSTLVLYDLNYAAGEIEYLADIPDFYERHDYDLAAQYLISRLKQTLPLGNASEAARADELRENYYTATQDIIDDIAVRYVTYENGVRPEGRAYPTSCQIGSKLYVGGGACVYSPPPVGACPPLVEYLASDINSDVSLADFHVFDLDTRTWTELAPPPWAHLFYCSTVVSPDGSEIWVVGGYTSSSMGTRSAEIYIYDVAGNRWRTLTDIPVGYQGRAKPGLLWVDDDTLLIMYGSRCDITVCGDCPCYEFNSLGDSWIVHKPTGGMYKYESDLPKTFTVMPSDQDNAYAELLYLPEPDPPPGGHTDIVEALAYARALSEDWTAYDEHYGYTLKSVYDQLKARYEGVEFLHKDGYYVSVSIDDEEGLSTAVVRLFNEVIPDMDPAELLETYTADVSGVGDVTQVPGTVLPIGYISAFDGDLTRSILFELSIREKGVGFIEEYEVTKRDLFTALDKMSNALYPVNRIKPDDALLIRKSLNTGEYLLIRKIVAPEIDFQVENIREVFQHKTGDWWLAGYFLGNLRFYRFSDRMDGDVDMLELVVDIPTDSDPKGIGYNGKDHVLCLFDRHNIWRLDLQTAIVNPNAEYWRRLPPALEVGKRFTDGMRSLMVGEHMLFVNRDGLVLQYDMGNFVWDVVRAGDFPGNSYVVVDNTELYYVGNDPSYFNCDTQQGDRFMINTDICELGIGTDVLPRLTVERNRVFGFDINNNLVAAFVRKRGIYDKSWTLPNYYYIRRILVSLDYDSLENELEVYLRTPTGLKVGTTYRVDAVEPWSFNEFTRKYENGRLETQLPDQYLAVDVDDYVSEVQVYYAPPIKNYGYVARVNGVLLVPEIYDGDMRASNHFVACPDNQQVNLPNLSTDGMVLEASVDDLDLAVSWDDKEFGSTIEWSIQGRHQKSIYLKALSRGKVVYLMVRNKSK